MTSKVARPGAAGVPSASAGAAAAAVGSSPDPSPMIVVTLNPNDAAAVLKTELNLKNTNDAKALLEAELKLTRKMIAFLEESSDSKSYEKRLSSEYTGPFRLGSVQNTILQFPISAIPAVRLKKYNKPKSLILSYGVRLRVREDLKIYREDCYLEIVRLPGDLKLGEICVSTLFELDHELYTGRFDPEGCAADTISGDLKNLLNLDSGGEYVSYESPAEVVSLFWDIQKSIDLRQSEDTDLFVIRIMYDGHTCLEKLCLEMESFSIWLYALDTGHLPDLKPSSIKPIKIQITSDTKISPGYGNTNFVKYFDKMEVKQQVPPLDQCLVIKMKEESIALITPHYLVRNEVLFVLRTWLHLQKFRMDALKKMLKYAEQSQEPNAIEGAQAARAAAPAPAPAPAPETTPAAASKEEFGEEDDASSDSDE